MKSWIVFVLVFSIFIYASAELDIKKLEIDPKKVIKLFGGRRLKGKLKFFFAFYQKLISFFRMQPR
jgi:hypothetical protein